MSKCAVKKCTNSTLNKKKHIGITFHIFPCRNPDMKEKWIDIIRVSRNQPSWNPTAYSKVCSAHFLEEDLYFTKNGLRRVKRNGYPKLFPATSSSVGTVNADPMLPHTSQTLCPLTSFRTINADPMLPHTSQTLCPLTSFRTINADPMLPHTSQTLCPPTSFRTINADPMLPHTSQTLCPPTSFRTINADPMLPHTSQTVSSKTPVPNLEEESSYISESPRKHKLRQRISELLDQQKKMKKKIKVLNQNVRRLKQKNKTLKDILRNLKNN